MTERSMFDLFSGETPKPSHPLLQLAARNKELATEATIRGRFNLAHEHVIHVNQLIKAVPELSPDSDSSKEPERELPRILAVCQKTTGSVELDDFFVAIPTFANNQSEENRKQLPRNHDLVITLFGDYVTAPRKALIFTQFLTDSEKRDLLRFAHPQ